MSSDHSTSRELPAQTVAETDQRDDRTEDFRPSTRLYVAFSSLLLMTLTVALDGTTVAVAISRIATALHGTAIQAFWIGTSYILTSTVFQPIFASLSYAFGRKSMIIVALVLFALGAILCGTAHNMAEMLAGRSVQGIGGAGLIAMTEVVLTDLIPLRQRGKYLGVIGAMYALGGGGGPIIGGALAQSNWRWIFWLNLPLIGIASICVVFFLPLGSLELNMQERFRRVDWLGSVLFVGSTTTFLIPISWGGVQEPWDSWRTLVPLFIGITTFAGFWIYEAFGTTEPLIPLHIFGNWSAIVAYATSVVQGFITYALLYFLPLYLEGAKGYRPLETGLGLLPFCIGVAPFATIAGIMITKLNGYRWAVWSGWAVMTLGMGLLLLLTPHTGIVSWIFLVLVAAIGNGIAVPAIQFQCQASQENQKTVGLALSVYSFTRSLGQTFGVSVGGVMFQNNLEKKLKHVPAFASRASQLARDATSLPAYINSLPAGGREKLALRTAYVDGLSIIWIFSAGICGLAMLVSFTVRAYSMDVGLETEQGLVMREIAVAGKAASKAEAGLSETSAA